MASSAPAPETAAPPPWHTAYPAPRNPEPGGVSQEEMLQMLKAHYANGDGTAPRDFVLVDVRRNDHTGGTIRGSINLPAQSLHPTLPAVYSLLKAAGVKKVIFYCGSCNGRGPRAAGWLADFAQDHGDSEMQCLILLGGIKGWARAGPDYTSWMDEYDEAVWKGKEGKE